MARYWNIRPAEFRNLEREEQSELAAIFDVERKIDSFYDYHKGKKMEQK